MEMGRERPRRPGEKLVRQPASGVAHAPLSLATASGQTCPHLCPVVGWPLSAMVHRTMWMSTTLSIPWSFSGAPGSCFSG